MHTSMAQCKTAVSPLLMHWRYCSLTLSHRPDLDIWGETLEVPLVQLSPNSKDNLSFQNDKWSLTTEKNHKHQIANNISYVSITHTLEL